ncbi:MULTISPECIES: tyrosine-type recombinase/integrase [Aliiglaciecola]|uniref:tyrosine-type recombinase/integrase n=1 Tax=Aliiglaciecola TaxID=1406885 RepID=UPI001C080AC3|nr:MULTISPECIES: tyrosine-type recombinase/integrase [Aliiglaciecola]MBU2878712.1 tyrosine-type recombinase/integrase [Aliiglaciecola lipolytica]MDO6711392.1 tyrosine-type recombinase/integrase [Aliiglaciecola sp. 2_MG-2023]MDO6752159.1 tyrosine-type recombinase/integrase [Aliiglaciecola sp. 1_MG-2023]
MTTEITKTILLDHAVGKTHKGHITIKPLAQVLEGLKVSDSSEFINIPLWENKALNIAKHGTVHFGDKTWHSYEEAQRNVTFSGEDELTYQIRIYSLLKLTHGDVVGGKPLKMSTLQNDVTYLNLIADFIRERGYHSFHELEFKSDLVIRNLIKDYLYEIAKIALYNQSHSFTKLFDVRRSFKLFGPKVCSIFFNVLEHLNNLHHPRPVTYSHPVIPTKVMKNILKFTAKVVESLKEKIDRWLELNARLIESLHGGLIEPPPKNDTFELIAKHIRNLPHEEEFFQLSEELEYLKLATYINILAYTGMRYNEALTCKIGCANHKGDIYYLTATMTKTDNSKVEMEWFSNAEVYESIELYEKYVIGMQERAQAVLSSCRANIKNSQAHNLKEGLKKNRLFGVSHSSGSVSFSNSGRFTKFEIKNSEHAELFNLTVDNEDIAELERLESNYKAIRGDKRGVPYEEGETLRLTAHMFRHTLAYFVIANKLGELDDIRYQFKHLTSLMTFVYTRRAFLASTTLIKTTEEFSEILIERVAEELIDEAESQSLKGGAGEQINKTSKDLIIGITDSQNKDSNVIKQIHFSSIEELKKFLVKNIQNIRGLPTGYCTAGEGCKIKGVGIPSGCVYCGSKIISKRHKVNWQIIKKEATDKLEAYAASSKEEQEEYELFAIHWKNNIAAADYVLDDAYKNNKGARA